MKFQSTLALLPFLALLVAADPQEAPQNGYDNDDGLTYHTCKFNSGKDFIRENEHTYRGKKDNEVEEVRYRSVPGQTVVVVVNQSFASSNSVSTTIRQSGNGRESYRIDRSDGDDDDDVDSDDGDDEHDSDDENDRSDDDDDRDDDEDDGSATYWRKDTPVPPVIPPTRFFVRDNSAILAPYRGYQMAINKVFALRINPKESRHLYSDKVYPNRTKCLAARRHGKNDGWRAVMEHCSDDQRFWKLSPFSLGFQKATGNRVWLTWMAPNGVKHCLHHDAHSSHFYPCADKNKRPEEFVILPTYVAGKVKIRRADKKRCLDGHHHNLWQNRCRGFSHQAWDIIDIAYNQPEPMRPGRRVTNY